MAEGRAVGDVYSTKALKAALPQKEEDEEKQLKVISLEIKVVSWNINGPGKAEPRNLLVPAVVQKENPDVLLLQEVPSDKIISLCNNNSEPSVGVRFLLSFDQVEFLFFFIHWSIQCKV